MVPSNLAQQKCEPMFMGHFKDSTIEIQTKYDRAENLYNWIDKKSGDVICKLHPISGFIGHYRLRVDEECPFYEKPTGVVTFNLEGVKGPGFLLHRTFDQLRVRKYCSREFFKLMYCQKEDFNRDMLYNARTVWDRHVWLNYGQFLHKLICQCQIDARYKGYDYFTISFWGQCAGVDRVGVKPKRKTGCYNGKYEPCSATDVECSGGALRDAVYKVIYNDEEEYLSRDQTRDYHASMKDIQRR